MAVLFIVNRASALASCLATAEASDTVLLIEDGVFGAIGAPAARSPIAALEPDLRARGLLGRIADGVRAISDADFVDLAIAHSPVVTWR